MDHLHRHGRSEHGCRAVLGVIGRYRGAEVALAPGLHPSRSRRLGKRMGSVLLTSLFFSHWSKVDLNAVTSIDFAVEGDRQKEAETDGEVRGLAAEIHRSVIPFDRSGGCSIRHSELI